MKQKRLSFTIKKCRKYTSHLTTLQLYQLNDTIYELNVEGDNIKEKIKVQ